MPQLVPIYDTDGAILLFDIYVDGKWIGSRRTEKQCAQAVAWERGK